MKMYTEKQIQLLHRTDDQRLSPKDVLGCQRVFLNLPELRQSYQKSLPKDVLDCPMGISQFSRVKPRLNPESSIPETVPA